MQDSLPGEGCAIWGAFTSCVRPGVLWGRQETPHWAQDPECGWQGSVSFLLLGMFTGTRLPPPGGCARDVNALLLLLVFFLLYKNTVVIENIEEERIHTESYSPWLHSY